MDPWECTLIAVALSILLSFLSWKFKLLTVDGAIASFIVGVIIGCFGSLTWLLALIVFTLLGFAATLIGISEKTKKGLQEGKHGERKWRNVLGVSVPCCIFAILNFVTNGQYYYVMMCAYITTVAVAASDTAGSEIGTRDHRVWLITTFKRVEPGVDGGISVFGTAVSLLASVAITIVAWLVINQSLTDITILLPMAAGFAGCLLDSVVGATLETWGYVDKYGNNCLTGILGALITVAVLSV
jgi:uncharacterized protein (TIGR00297 family)